MSVDKNVDRRARRETSDLLEDRNLSGSPRGFMDRTKSSLSYDPGTRTVTLTPAADCVIYVFGVKLKPGVALSVVHANTAGLHFITISSAGVLQTSMTPWNIYTEQPVAIVYFNTATGWIADERHGKMSAATHAYLHLTIGARWASGLAVSGTATASGAPTTDAQSQIAVTAGTFHDEDLTISITARGTPSPFAAGQIPELYWDGSKWIAATATDWPFSVGANDRPQYQNPAGGMTEAGNNRYTVHWIFGTNFTGLELVSIPHPAEFTTIETAQAASADSLNLSALPTPEMILLSRIILETRDTYTTPARKAVTRRIDDYRRALGPVTSAPVPVSHASLAGLSADDHPQYVYHGESRQDFTATAGQNVFDLSFSYTTGAKELLVFVGGVLIPQTDFTETSSTRITLGTGLPAGTPVRVFRL